MTRGSVAWLVGFSVLLARVAWAEEPSLELALKHYQELDYPGAITVGGQLLAGGRNGPEELRRIYELLGRSLASADRAQEARAFFRRLLALQPDFRLPESVSPKIQVPLSQAQQDLAGKPGLTVALTGPASSPWDKPLHLVVRVVSDPLRMVHAARVVYSLPHQGTESTLKVRANDGDLVFRKVLPSRGMRAGVLRVRVETLDRVGNVLWQSSEPLAVQLTGPRASAARAVDPPRPWYQEWWIWTLAGVVVTGATVGAIAATSSSGSTGDVRFGWSVQQLRW
jgi:hypothetical protein